MKKQLLVSLLAVCIAASLFAGCTNQQKPEPAPDSSAPPVSSSGAPSSSVEGTVDGESSSETPVSSVPPASQPAESSPGQVLPVETDDKGFDAKFRNNPIDKAYIKDNNNAISNRDMVEVSDKYAEIWKKEVSSAYEKLLEKVSADRCETLKTEQKAWSDGTESALREIEEEAAAVGGTMAQVDASSRVMDYYRSRAAKLYEELYAVDPDYAYDFSENS
ncbi:lysozyme inhibitor LprI family protein [Clostridium sp. D33t1_170424_F3]|uniref:lysozyme inhibitor LprI family protein n=1 Tax=Clostridium sp. D33t1_170424_F3 TaxID=2787099 RepID=UPI0018ABEE66|nr:lysozyme inhibitor LprI family protein [Clostridium sp. D33t1_170424_F3]